ncbi:hypothetical protein NFI96_026266, partial [Prochilodus magdalenae]
SAQKAAVPEISRDMVERDIGRSSIGMKPICGSTESILASSLESNDDDSCDFTRNEMTEDDLVGSQGHLKPQYGSSSSDGWNSSSISSLDPEQTWYHLPRSSPVISRKARFPSMEQSSEGSSPISLSSTPPVQIRASITASSSPGFSKGFLSKEELPGVDSSVPGICQQFPDAVPPCFPAVEKCLTRQAPVSTNSDQQGNFSGGLTGSRSAPENRGLSLSDGMVQQLNGTTWPENKNRACSDTHLISGPVSEKRISEDFYRNSVDLDQENAHFVVVDMVLEVLEAVKWTMCQQELKHTDFSEDRDTELRSETRELDSVSSFDSGYGDYCGHGFSSNRSSRTSIRRSLKISRCSAEGLAQRLLTKLRKQWVVSEKSFSCGEQCPTLEEVRAFPLDTVSMMTGGKLSEEIRQRSRMRGTLTWAPPRFQIIFNVQPAQRRSDVIASQHFLCAGCGTEVEPRYIKRLRYCDYLGRYFCDGCHSGGESVIPGRVLNRWDFRCYPVCTFSKQLLDSIWEQPLFKLTAVAKNLYSQAKELQRFKELQEQLISIKKLLRACRLSDEVLVEFQQLPSHLTEELHLFSMDDLVKVKRGQLVPPAKAILLSATAHVEACELCQANGFICEFCHGQDVLFPFQTDICTRCQECRTCFHTACFRDEPCPRCTRLQIRKSLQDTASV